MSNTVNTDVNIKYYATAQAWQMEYPAGTGTWKGAPDYCSLNVGQSDKANITFTITDSPGVEFLKNDDAISDVAIASGKGKPVVGTNSGQLENIATSSGDTVLKVKDKNSYTIPFDINYTLHFKNGVPDLDPIIKNGGQQPLMARSAPLSGGVLFFGAVVVAVLAFMIGRLTEG